MAQRAHVYILTASHDDYTQGDELIDVFTSEKKAKARAREEAGVARLTWEGTGSVRTHRRFVLFAEGPRAVDESPWRYSITAARPQ